MFMTANTPESPNQPGAAGGLSPKEARYMQVKRIVNGVWLLSGILEGLIAIRVLLKLIGANPNSPFASFVYTVTGPFLALFRNLVNNPSYQGGVFELTSLIAMIVYSLATWVVVRLIWLIAYRPESYPA
jgi:uncharacterized protein YggT (Ycf19 family)